MSAKITGKARVQLTIEVELATTWGDNCTIGQLHKQGAEDAIGEVRRKLNNSGAQISAPVSWRLIDSKVLGILTEAST